MPTGASGRGSWAVLRERGAVVVLDRAVGTGGCQEPAVGTEGDAMKPAGRVGEGEQFLAAVGVPDLGDAVHAHRHQPAAVGAEVSLQDKVLVATKVAQLAATGSFIDPDSVIGGDDQPAAVGAEPDPARPLVLARD